MPPQPAAPDRASRGEQIRPNDILGTADINYPLWVSLIEHRKAQKKNKKKKKKTKQYTAEQQAEYKKNRLTKKKRR